LTLQGSLDAEKETALRSLLSEWRDNTGNKIDLVFSLNSQARPSTQKASAPAAPQASIQPVGLFLGDNPYVVLQGRKRLTKGDDWNGATVTAIGTDGIQVTQSNQTMTISFAAQPMWVVHSSGVSAKQRS